MKNHLKLLLFLIIPLFLSGQTKPVKITIVSITSIDSIPEERKFTIQYSIENTSNEEVSFFLQPEKLFPAHSNAMGTNVFYKLFQGKDELIIDGVFTNQKLKKFYDKPDYSKMVLGADKDEALEKSFKEFITKLNDSLDKLTKNGVTRTDLLKDGISKTLLKTVYNLQPKETKTYSTVWYWDKQRYFKRDEYEYYLNEKGTFYIQIYLFLMKEEYKYKLTKDDYDSIMKMPNFIKGVFQSEKVEINFKE